MRLERPRYSFLDVARLTGAVVGAFFTGLVASGTFWYALILEFQNYSILPLPWPVFILFGTSATLTCLFSGVTVKVRRRLPMKYTVTPFLIGDLIAAMAGIILFGILLWGASGRRNRRVM